LGGVLAKVSQMQEKEKVLMVKADENFDSGIVKTIEWYLNKYGINK
jgi:dTDP-D-glucose 4,6-dehydratase